MSLKPMINILGAGKVGASLARALASSGAVELGSILNSTIESTLDAAAFIGAGNAAPSLSECLPADVWILGMEDRKQTDILRSLSGGSALRSDDVVISLSGFLSSEDLRLSGARQPLGTMHPVQTFPRRTAETGFFRSFPFAIEGDPEALLRIREIAAAISSKTFDIESHSKRLYHAGLVIMCNYLSVLAAHGFKAWAEAGIAEADARALSAPIMRRTLENILAHGPLEALSGPAVRGDYMIVDCEAQALSKQDPSLGEFYAVLARFTEKLAGIRRGD